MSRFKLRRQTAPLVSTLRRALNDGLVFSR